MLEIKLPRRTLQRRLALLVDQNQLAITGRGRGSRYRLPSSGIEVHPAPAEIYIPISPEGEVIKVAVRKSVQERHPMGYNRAFLDDYRPNVSFYLPSDIRQRLFELGHSPDGDHPAGTYARQIYNRLLGNPQACGRLRATAVGIGGTVYHPLEVPQLVDECFQQILDTVMAIADPFEQAFFAMVHLPYLQPFEDVNKRVSRLAAHPP